MAIIKITEGITGEQAANIIYQNDLETQKGNLPNETAVIFDPDTDIVTGSHIVAPSGNVIDNISSLRTDYLDIRGASKVLIGGRNGVTTSLFFYDDNFNYIQSIEAPAEPVTLHRNEMPEGAAYIISNLKVANGASVAGTFYAESVTFTDISRLDAGLSELDSVAVRKAEDATLYTAADEITGVSLNGTTGVLTNSPSGGFTGYLDISAAKSVTLANFPEGLNVKWFFTEAKQPILSVNINSGELDLGRSAPPNARYFAFNTRTGTISPTGSETVTAENNELEKLTEAAGFVKKDQVYRKEYHALYDPALAAYDQILNTSGSPRNEAGQAWTGYLQIKQGMDILIEGVPTGFNSKFFYGNNKSVIGSYTINNGRIKKEDIPAGAVYIGLNLKNPILGDGTETARVFSFIDDLEDLNPDVNIVNTVFGIPAVIPVVQGIQANIYLDNIRSNPVNDTTELFVHEGAAITNTKSNPYAYKVNRSERALQYTPTVAGQTVQMHARLRDVNYNVLVQRSFQFRSISPEAGDGLNKICLLCGDSQIDTTYDGAETSFAPFLKDHFDQSGTVNMDFVGTQVLSETVVYGETPAENRVVSCPTEGYGGWQINRFYENLSPFWNPNKAGGADIDFINWMAERGRAGEQIDYFVFPMGVNDFNAGVSIEGIIERMETMQAVLWRDFPDCKFIIGMVTQGSKYWSMDVRRKWNIEYYDALVRKFETPEYAGRVYLAAAGLWTDNIFGSRQIRPFVEPYQRIVDTKNLLINKLKQSGLSEAEAVEKVNVDYGLEVKERTLTRWMDEHPGTTDIVHSSWVSAMQQADCYYSYIKYILSTT